MTSVPPVDRATLVATRRDIHQHPELGFEETRTATLIAERLKGLDYDVKSGVGKTGVVALKKKAGRCVLLRADMDALPVEEANAVPYRSKYPARCTHAVTTGTSRSDSKSRAGWPASTWAAA